MTTRYKTRLTNKSDLNRIQEINDAALEYPLGREDLTEAIEKAHMYGLCVENPEGLVVGYLQYARLDEYYVMTCIAVHPDYQRQGYGSRLIETLKSKRSKTRPVIKTFVRDALLGAQLFLKKHEFWACQILKNRYDFCMDDCYVFMFPKPPLQIEDKSNENQASNSEPCTDLVLCSSDGKRDVP